MNGNLSPRRYLPGKINDQRQCRRVPLGVSWPPGTRLLSFENFGDRGFPAFVDGDDLVDGLESAQGDINHVVSRPQHDIDWRHLVEDTLVDRNLCALRLRVHTDGTHAGRTVSAMSEELVELADGTHIRGVAERSKLRRVL